MIFCKNCGARLEDSVTFCTQCGVRVTKPASVPAETALSEATLAPETSAVPETGAVPETSVAPETGAVPGTEAVPGTGAAAEEEPRVSTENRVPEESRVSEEPRFPAREFTETHSAPPMSGTFLPPPTAGAEKPAKEKTFFGIGALIFCLIVIGALSIATGVFAGLYFSAAA